jgi:biotin transport system substrate-specific component
MPQVSRTAMRRTGANLFAPAAAVPLPAAILRSVLFALAGALFTGLCARARMTLLGTPVPVTGQVFAVLVCGALLGRWTGALSQVFYLALACLGVAWLAGATTGARVLGLPTSGYLYGFIVAALFLGFTSRLSRWTRSFDGQFFLMTAAVGIIYACGLAGLCLTLGVTPAIGMVMGWFPFVLFDLAKILAAAALTSRVLKK